MMVPVGFPTALSDKNEDGARAGESEVARRGAEVTESARDELRTVGARVV